jgi:hypothetical protein
MIFLRPEAYDIWLVDDAVASIPRHRMRWFQQMWMRQIRAAPWSLDALGQGNGTDRDRLVDAFAVDCGGIPV